MKLRSAGNVLITLEEGSRVVEFTDSVVFDYAGYHMTAGRLTLNESLGQAWAEGGVNLSGPAGYAHARQARLELATERVVLEDLEARLGPWSASARKADMAGPEMNLYHAVLTSCPTPNPIYSLHARRLTRESPFRYVARGVVPHFYFVPFFYVPKYTYELEQAEEEGGALVPSRQGLEFNPGRGNYPGFFLKTTWRRKFLERKLLSTTHVDYYTKPGPAIGEEIQFKSAATDHYTYGFFSRARTVDRLGGYKRLSGYDNRWRLWQIWTWRFPSGHFKAFINEISDSNIENDYRLNIGEMRLRDREMSAELAVNRPRYSVKILADHFKTLNTLGNNYVLDRKLLPSAKLFTFPLPIAGPKSTADRRGWRFYGSGGMSAGFGHDAAFRPDGFLASGTVSSLLSAHVAGRLTSSLELTAQNDYHQKERPLEPVSNTPMTRARWTLHHPWWHGRLQAATGYSLQTLWENETLYPPDGEIENLLFASLRSNLPHWKTALDFGYDLRSAYTGLSTVDFQTRYHADWIKSLASFVRYDPERNRIQSVYSNGAFALGRWAEASLGFQAVRTDSETQIQFTPAAAFRTPGGKYSLAFSGFYDAKLDKWRTLETSLTRAFRCIATTMRLSKREDDFQINLSFRLTGFKADPNLFRRSDVNPSATGAGTLGQ